VRARFAVGAALLAQTLCVLAPAIVAGISLRDEVVFETFGQPLLGAGAGQGSASKSIPFGSTPVFRDRRGPLSHGAIFRLEQPIPVETAQAIWQRAVAICRHELVRTQTVSVTLPVVGTVSRSCRGRATPTEAQCIAGGNIRPVVQATCCLYGGTYPNCTDLLGPDTVTVATDRLSFDVGPGIGPRPTSGTMRPYDIGLIAEVSSDVEIGVEGELVLDGGSVDVVYPTAVHLATTADAVVPGGVFAIYGSHAPTSPSLASEYPNVSLALNTTAKIDARAIVEYAGIDYSSGEQIRGTRAISAFATADDPEADEQGRIVNSVVEVKAGLGAGLQVRVNTDVALGGFEGRVLDPIGPFVLPLQFPFDVTIPPKPAPFCEVLPRPDCSFNPPVSTDVVEMLFRTPLLDTPAHPDFDGGNAFTGVAGADERIEQAREQLRPDGSLRNTTITGKRDALQSSLEAVGGDLSKLSIDDGVIDTDLVRLGVDIDGSLVGFGLPPGGGQLELPPQLPAGFPIAKLAGKRLLEVEANLIDLDVVDFLYFDQEIVFHPNLVVELVFSRSVQVRAGGAAEFAEVVADERGEYVVELPLWRHRVEAVEVIQPEGGVQVFPRYSLAANRLDNNLDWLINAGVQGTVGQLAIGGYIAAVVAPIISGVSEVEDLDFALGRFAPSFDEPLRFPAHDSFGLDGFGEPVAGTPFAVSVRELPPRPCGGDCNGDEMVDVDELVLLVGVALGEAHPAVCGAGDLDRNRDVTVDEIVAGLNASNTGCAGEA